MNSTRSSLCIPNSALLLGLRFICIDDRFNQPAVRDHYSSLPRQGNIYTLHELHLGFQSDGTPCYAGNFEELPLIKPGAGLFLQRFAPVEGSKQVRAPSPSEKSGQSYLLCALKTFTPAPASYQFLQAVRHPVSGEAVNLYFPHTHLS